MDVKPNFLIIGAQKAGTTALHYALKPHPQIFLPKEKEIHYFSIDKYYDRGPEWYLSHFVDGANAIAIGEASTSYSSSYLRPRTVSRITKLLPDTKLIYSVRHPLERIESHWMHKWRFGQTKLSFEEELRTSRELIDCSLYFKQISEYRAYFPDQRIKIVFSEDFREQPGPVMQGILSFLGIDMSIPLDLSRTHNPSIGDESDVPKGVVRQLLNRPKWPPKLRRNFLTRISPDAHAFLRYAGRGDNYWDLL